MDHDTFTRDLFAAGFQVEDYEPRAYDVRPAVRADDELELQAIIRATTVVVEWDSLGMGYIVYPVERKTR